MCNIFNMYFFFFMHYFGISKVTRIMNSLKCIILIMLNDPFFILISQVICMLSALLNNFTSNEIVYSEPLLPLVLGDGLFVKKK